MALLVVLVAVILPSLAWGQVIGTVGQVQGPAGFSPVPSPVQSARRRIVVRFEFSGDAYRLQEWFPRYLQSQVAKSGLVEVVVWDRDWDEVTKAQDLIADSGRYSPETVVQVPRGQMVAPTDYYVVTVEYTTRRINVGGFLGGIKLFGQRLDSVVRVEDHVTVEIRLNVQPWDIRTGALQPGWTVKGSAKGLDGISIQSGRWGQAIGLDGFISGIEKSLEGQAARGACNEFLKRFSPTPLVAKRR